ncbi:MAG: Asp23/Gls24 family envelope stress response protein [Firmicutes bacterium]|nr:Asp23/Gls24 family envelope stress response protein [Bacillota bacterium]
MLAKENNENGLISLNSILLEQIIHKALEPYKGKVWLANYKGSASDTLFKLGGFDALAEKEVVNDEKGLYVKLYLVLSFGTSIGSTCRDIIFSIDEAAGSMLQLKVWDVAVQVTGVYSKKIAQRDISYSLRGIRAAEGLKRDGQ